MLEDRGVLPRLLPKIGGTTCIPPKKESNLLKGTPMSETSPIVGPPGTGSVWFEGPPPPSAETCVARFGPSAVVAE